MRKFAGIFAAALLAAGCISNDLPYPVVVPSVTAVTGSGITAISVDEAASSVCITLDESADIQNVDISGITVTNDATVSPEALGKHDMRDGFNFTLTTYQEYTWWMSAEQPMERYFTVQGQVGASEVDAANLRAIAYVREGTDLSALRITSLKLGGRGVSTCSLAEGDIRDFSDAVPVQVKAHGRTEEWLLYVEQTEVSVTWKYVEPWTGVAWLAASGLADEKNGFRYRKAGAGEWTTVSEVISDGGAFSAMISGLEPLTTYECVAFSGSEDTDIKTFTTEADRQLPNAGFETFSMCESQNYYSFFDPSSSDESLSKKWWDNGNVGSTTVGSAYSICSPDTSDRKEGGASAKLTSRNVVIKFAAGNLFSGEFAGLIGTQGGKVNFGRPFTLRPRSLKLWVKYDCGTVDCVGSYPSDVPVKIGDKDKGTIYVALGDWDYHKYGGTPESPVQVNTTDKSTFFKSDSEAVIAYGAWVASESTDGWMELEIPLEYVSVTRKPTHIIVSCASSMLGDYFTGSSQSVLRVDDMRLIY